VLHNLASTRLLTSATGYGAIIPSGPLTDLAVYRARASIARLGFFKTRACLATDGLGKNITGAEVYTVGSTGLGTLGPDTPGGHGAINRASFGIASFGLLGETAKKAAVLGGYNNLTGTLVCANTAGFGALAPRGPLAQLAVNRARLGIAPGILGQRRANVSTVLCVLEDSTRSGFLSAAASLGTVGPKTPARNLAVNWARASIADLGHFSGRANAASVGVFSLDSARTGLGATAAGNGAFTPLAPLGNSAVNRATLNIALLNVIQSRTNKATVLRHFGDGSGSLHTASTTRLRALGIG